MSKEEHNKIFYDPMNEIVCDRFALEKLVKESEAKDKHISDIREQLAITEKALELAVSQLDDAKDMLRECGKRDWAGMIDTSVDYFKARAKENLKSE